MPVHVYDEGTESAAPSPPPGRRRLLLLVAALSVVIVVLVAVIAWPSGAPAADPTPGGAATTPTGTTPQPTTASPGQTSVLPNLGEAVPGLYFGTATVTSGNTKSLYGIPYGWNKTTDGAVAAAMTVSASFCALPVMVDDTRAALTPILFTQDGEAFQTNAADYAIMRKGSRLNDAGVVVAADGRVSEGETYLACGMPRFGAYKVVSTTGDDLVIVDVWMPYTAGPGSDDNLSEVWLGAIHARVTMRWSERNGSEDWRLAYNESLRGKGVLPAKRSNIGHQAIRDLLGPGWFVPADTTTKPYPGSVWAS